MKIAKYIVIVLIVLVIGIYGLLFTNFGNSFVASYASKTIQEKSGINIKIEHFYLRPNKLELNALIQNDIAFQTQGSLSLLNRSFDLDYKINADKVQDKKLREPIKISGKAKGSISDFDVNGSGIGLGSNIAFLSNLKNYEPNIVKLEAKSLNINDLLILLGKPTYLKGNIDITADINQVNKINKGIANITVKANVDDIDMIKKDFGINLSKNFNIDAKTDAKIDGSLIMAKMDVLTPIATAKTTNTLYNIDQDLLGTDLTVLVPNLEKLQTIINQKLNGSLKLSSNITVNKGELSKLSAILEGIGGSIIANLNDGTLSAKIENIDIAKGLHLAGQSAYASGKINGLVQIQNLNQSNMNGKIYIKTQDSKINKSALKDSKILQDVNFDAEITSSIKDNVADFETNINSALLSIKQLKGRYDLRARALKSDFEITSGNLDEFEKIIGTKLSSPINLKGEVIANDAQLSSIKAEGKALDGEIQAKFDGKNLNAKLSNLNLQDLFLLAGQEPLIQARADFNANGSGTDLSNIDAKANLSINKGILSSKSLSKIFEKNIKDNINFSLKSNLNIENGVAKVDALLDSNVAQIKNLIATYDLKNSTHEAGFDILIPELSNLQFATNTQLYGQLNAKVTSSGSKDNLKAHLISDIFGGKLNANLINNQVDATINNARVQDMLKMIGYQPFYEGLGEAKANYNLNSQIGKFNVDLKEGQLKNTNLVKLVSTLTQKDLSKEVFKDGLVKGNINKELIDFIAELNSPDTQIKVSKGTINTITKALNIPLYMKIQKTDLQVDIHGTTDEPKYKANSDYLKKKATNAIEKLIDKKLGSDKDDKNGNKETIKGLLKGLFN